MTGGLPKERLVGLVVSHGHSLGIANTVAACPTGDVQLAGRDARPTTASGYTAR